MIFMPMALFVTPLTTNGNYKLDAWIQRKIKPYHREQL